MTSSAIEIVLPSAVSAVVSEDTLTVDLSDGRTISVPLSWYPRLVHGTSEERGEWRLIGGGHGIHWPRLDEDISVEGLIAIHPANDRNRFSGGLKAVVADDQKDRVIPTEASRTERPSREHLPGCGLRSGGIWSRDSLSSRHALVCFVP